RVFPVAHFEVYISDDAAVEAESFTSPRISVHRVGAGRIAWMRLAIRLALRRPMPTLFLAAQSRRAAPRPPTPLSPICHPIVLPPTHPVVRPLRRILDAEPT